MDFGIRELLMFIGALIFIGVVIDGVRRFQDNRKKQIKLEVSRKSSAIELEDDEEDDWYSAELPGGKARVKGGKYDESDEDKIPPRFSEPLDILMEGSHLAEKNLSEGDAAIQLKTNALQDEVAVKPKVLEDALEEDLDGIVSPARVRETKSDSQSVARHFEEKPQRSKEPQRNQEPQPTLETRRETTTRLNATKPSINQGDLFVASDESEEDDEAPDNDLPEEVLSVNVIAKKGQEIDGQALLQAVQSFGLRYGDMDIFHRHEHSTGQGPVIFSMANAINPGTFDIDSLSESQVKGVTFFMRLSSVNKRIFVLELMVDIAKRLANQLGAELKDDTHSVLSSQTVTHYKSRIQEYERRYLGQVLRK